MPTSSSAGAEGALGGLRAFSESHASEMPERREGGGRKNVHQTLFSAEKMSDALRESPYV